MSPPLQIGDPSRLAFVTQTTLSVDDTQRVVSALKVKYPELASPRKETFAMRRRTVKMRSKRWSHACDITW